MSPPNINQVNNIRRESLICFLAIIVARGSWLDLQYTIHELLPSIIAVVHRVLPQFQILEVDTGAAGYGAKGVLDSFDL